MNDVPLPDKAVTIAEVFAAAGYTTGYIGKWHLDGRGRSNYIPRERRQGFQYWKALECSHDYNRSFYYADDRKLRQWEGYDAIAQTNDAREYMQAAAKSEKPFCLFLAWGPPHAPYHTAPPKYKAMYDAAKLKLRPNVPEYLHSSVRRDLAGYYAHCTALDDCLAQMRKTLNDIGIADNTILVFTSDHGDLLGSHHYYKKQQPYEESIRIPMLFHFPRELGKDGKRLEAIFNTEDIMPTLLGLCGVKIPVSVEGLNYSAYLKGGENPSDDIALITCPAPFGQWSYMRGGREFRGIRTLRYTYVRDLAGPWLLFDNKRDPHQLKNLVHKPEFAKLQAELESALQRKLKESEDQFRPSVEYVKRWGYKLDQSGTVPYTR